MKDWLSTVGYVGRLLVAAWLFVVLIIGLSLLPRGARDIGPIETIQGLPYPEREGKYVISEPLAHADVNLIEPAIAKTLVLDFEYLPRDTQQLAVGVRENSFWLSYPRQTFYRHSDNASVTVARHATVYLPLTGALQDKDRSVDLMFFADGVQDDSWQKQPEHVHTAWEIVDVRARVEYAWPTPAELKDFARAVITRERPL